MGEKDKFLILIKYFDVIFSITDKKSRKKDSKILKGWNTLSINLT